MGLEFIEEWINGIRVALDGEEVQELPIGTATRVKNEGASQAFQLLSNLPGWQLAFNNSGSVTATIFYDKLNIPDGVYYVGMNFVGIQFMLSVAAECAELRFERLSDAADVLLSDHTPFAPPIFLHSDFSQLVEELRIRHLNSRLMASLAETAWMEAEIAWHARKKMNLNMSTLN